MRTHLRVLPDGARVHPPPRRPVVSAPLGETGWTATDAPSPPGVDSQALDLWLPGGTIVRLRTTPLPGGRPGSVHLVLDAVGGRDELIEMIVTPMLLTSRPPRV